MAHRTDLESVYSGAVTEVLTDADRSRKPMPLDVLFDLAAAAGVGTGSLVLDAGCANGASSRKLIARTGCRVEGVELLPHLAELGRRETTKAGLDSGFRIRVGSMLDLPFPDGHFDFVWCRDVITLIEDLPAALAECARVLRGAGSMLIYATLATDRLSDTEQAELNRAQGTVTSSMDEAHVENCLAAGFDVMRKVEIGSQGRQYEEEAGDHETTGNLVRAARLLTWPQHYIAEHGQIAYRTALTEAYWGIYQMLGKLRPTAYLLTQKTPAGS